MVDMTITPDGHPLAQRMCTCTIHCQNRCEVACCGPDPAWCNCWCHAQEYAEMRASREKKTQPTEAPR